ncbi:extracellular ribonuclease-like isoform X4 [Rhodamnia argentea]|uniref:Extracellular ribonuclease-like isoform X4 n=1 Tax=Rhodamnia argentea TaxID=178133 RepID=A0A8B8PLH5_9MYRT|nr:extracellular ribonuclease-like isoform X4 [Rhodamnia argentea]
MGFFLVMRFIVIRCHIRVDNGKVLAFAANRRTCRARPHCPPVQGQALVLPLRNSLSFITRLFPSLLHPALPPEARDYRSPPSFTHVCEDIDTYYAQLRNSKGQALPKKLHSLIYTHRSLSYKQVWDVLKILDAADVDNPEASPGVVEIYTLKIVPKALAGKPDGWNREHLWPRSYGLVDRVSLSDLHNLRPSDINVNSSRGNKYYGECAFTSAKCLRPANKEAAIDTESDSKSWAPPRQVRGDIARALMYMAVCYGYHQPGGGSDLQLSDSPSIEKKEMGLLSTLLRWNKLDPPSREEKLRNDRICKFYQHNRNPFVDHPEYADLIWKLK